MQASRKGWPYYIRPLHQGYNRLVERRATPRSGNGSRGVRKAGHPQEIALLYADPLRWLWEPYWHRI